MMLTVPISVGELIDKITILQIKSERISDASKKANVDRELQELNTVRDGAQINTPELEKLASELKRVNEELWVIEDQIRLREAEKDFGKEFIELARAVYVTNDQRAALKKQVNLLTGSALVEEKSYKGS